MNRLRWLSTLGCALAILSAGCAGRSAESKHENDDAREAAAHSESHEAHEEESSHVELSAEARVASGIEVESAAARTIRVTLDLPGEVVPNADRLAHIVPRFPGIAREVRKGLGDPVQEGETLAIIEGNQSMATYEVRSLISGTVIEKHVTLGEFVRDDQDIYVVADLSTVWVNIAIYARDVHRTRRGQRVTVAAVGEGPTADGRIDYIGSVVGESTRAATARVVLDNAEQRWRPGTFVTARIAIAEQPARVAVPDRAIQRLEGRDCLFVEEGDGFLAKPVSLGATDGEWIEVLSGIEPGERVVVRGGFILKSELQKSEAGHEH